MPPQPSQLQQRVIDAAEAALAANGSVGPLELLQYMRLLEPSHVQAWRKGREETLAQWIQGSPEKLRKTYAYFQEWVASRHLKPVQASYLRAGAKGNEKLRVTQS